MLACSTSSLIAGFRTQSIARVSLVEGGTGWLAGGETGDGETFSHILTGKHNLDVARSNLISIEL